MKVLFCTNAFENITNGPAKFANLILEINERYPHHSLKVLTEDVAEDRLPELPHVYRITLRIPRLLKPLGQILRMFQYYRRVKQIERDYPFDLLVYNNAFTGLWAAMVSRKPTVGLINDEKNLRASLAHFRPDRWWLKAFAFRYLEKWSTRLHRLIITNSDFLTRRVIEAYQVPPAKVRRLYKSIDFSSIPFQSERHFSNLIRVLFVKADYRVGRLDVLIQALARLPEYSFHLVVMGPEKQFEAQLRALQAGIANVYMDNLGAQPQRVVYEYLRTSDLFCVPSATEALGVANMEALAFGIPVISTQVGGIPEVLDHGNNGWLVPTGDPVALAAAIRACIQQPEIRRLKAENGRKFIQVFDKDAMLGNFVRILEEVCS